MGKEEVFILIQVDGKQDEYKCKECDKTYTVAGSVRKHFQAKYKKNQESNETSKSEEDQLQEDEDSVDDFNPEDDDVHKSTQNGEKTLSAEDIKKMYEDDSGKAEEETTKEVEQTQFPEHEIMVRLIETAGKSKDVSDVNNDEDEINSSEQI